MGSPVPTHNYEACKNRLVGKLEVLRVLDTFDGVGDLHNTLHEGHFEADVLCPEKNVRENLFAKDSREP